INSHYPASAMGHAPLLLLFANQFYLSTYLCEIIMNIYLPNLAELLDFALFLKFFDSDFIQATNL
ncbi:MAG: hypothetical protein LBV41_04840, partial [Cytophagaceae bacterium]|nr:hypothetical protein [Cytophagaceae bacterium]